MSELLYFELKARIEKLERIVGDTGYSDEAQQSPVTEVGTSRRALFDLYHALGEGMETLQSENAGLRARVVHLEKENKKNADLLSRVDGTMRSVSERLAKAMRDGRIRLVGIRWAALCSGKQYWMYFDSIIDALNALERPAG